MPGKIFRLSLLIAATVCLMLIGCLAVYEFVHHRDFDSIVVAALGIGSGLCGTWVLWQNLRQYRRTGVLPG